LHRPGNTTLAIALLAAGSLALSACGRDKADLVAGKTAFVNKCGACHVLARANTKGIQGPSLDSAFADDRQIGMNSRTFRGVVKHQIAYPRRGSIMPANLVTDQAADDVAAYVGFAAGNPGKDTGALAEAGAPKTSSKPAVAVNGKLTIPAVDGTAFAFSKAEAPAGSITFDMPNKSPLPHDIGVKGNGIDKSGPVVPQGKDSVLTIALKPGTYEFFCSVPGHEQAGLKGTLTVK
jgi:mono/diheme cytochrome c family protein